MKDREITAREGLARAAEALETLQDQLKTLGANLPVSNREDLMYAGEEELDFPTEARATIECILADRLTPAIQELREAAEVKKKVQGLPEQALHIEEIP